MRFAYVERTDPMRCAPAALPRCAYARRLRTYGAHMLTRQQQRWRGFLRYALSQEYIYARARTLVVMLLCHV